jgi:hypothetical protein
MRVIYLIIFNCLLIGCSSNIKDHSGNNVDSIIPSITAETLSVDSEYITKLKELKNTENQRELKFISELLNAISKFENAAADTSLQIVANIDNKGTLDTLNNRIFVKNDTVHIISIWQRNGELLWEYELTNPYLWISEKPEFEFGKRSIWVTFTIAIKYALPKIYNHKELAGISIETANQIANEYLNMKQQDSIDLIEYLTNFQGDLIEFGDPEQSEGIFFWHEPSKQFILYYGS